MSRRQASAVVGTSAGGGDRLAEGSSCGHGHPDRPLPFEQGESGDTAVPFEGEAHGRLAYYADGVAPRAMASPAETGLLMASAPSGARAATPSIACNKRKDAAAAHACEIQATG